MIEIYPNQTTVGATIMLNPNAIQNVEDFIYLEHPIMFQRIYIPLFMLKQSTLSKQQN